MRKLLSATAALSALLATSLAANAADMYVKAPPPAPPPPPFSWTGFYIGGNFGGAWFHADDVRDTLFNVDFGHQGNNNGAFIGGGQVGFNYQVNSVVFGVEGDFDWAANNNNGTAVIIPTVNQLIAGHSFLVTGNNRWAATVAARLGWTATERLLFYVKGGGGWVGADSFTITDVTTGLSVTDGTSNNNLGGWLVGGGLEWAFADNWSVRFEYDFLGLNSRTFTVPLTSPFIAFRGDTFTTGNRNLSMATVGLNYRFNWYNNTRPSPVTTRY